MRPVAAALVLVGCLSTPDPAPPPVPACFAGNDLDGDGWACDAALPDCDDDDAAIHPGAVDEPGDGVDGDCLDGDTSAGDLLEGVSVDDASGFAIVTPTHRIVFDAGGTLMPLAIIERASGVDLLGGGGVRFALTPGFDTGSALGDVRSVLARGPAFAQVYSGWTGSVGGEPVGGTFAMGVAPDGRVERLDESSTDHAVAGGPYDVTASTTLVATRFDAIDWGGSTAAVLVAGADGEVWSSLDESGWACVSGTGRQVGMAWTGYGSGASGPRIVADAAAGTVTLAFDVARDQAELSPGGYGATTMWLLGDEGSCQDSADVGADVLARPTLTVSGGSLIDYADGELLHYFTADADHVELTVQDLPHRAGMLFQGTFAAAATGHGVTVWRNDVRLAAGVDYLVQRDIEPNSEPRITVWIPRLLLVGDRVRIAVPGGEP